MTLAAGPGTYNRAVTGRSAGWRSDEDPHVAPEAPRHTLLAAGLVAVSIVGGAASRRKGAMVGDFEAGADVGAPRAAGLGHLQRRLAGVPALRRGRQHVGRAGRVPLRLEADEGRLHPPGAGASSSARASTRTASWAWIVRTSLDADSPYADVAVHGDGLTSLQFRRTKGAITEQVPSPIKGADVIQLERKGNTYTLSAARFGEPFTTQPGRGPRPGRRRLRGALPLLAQPRRGGERGLPRRAPRPPGPGRLRALPRLHRQPPRDPRRPDRAPAGGPQLRGALRGAQLDARRPRAHLQHQRPLRGPGTALPLRPRHAAAVA